MTQPGASPLPRLVSGRPVVYLLSILLAYAAWMRGGTHSGYQAPMLWLSALTIAVLLTSQIVNTLRCRRLRRADDRGSLGWGNPLLSRLLTDPVTYAALVFITLITVQWWNAGRVFLFDYDLGKWIYSPPRIANMPSAVDRGEALEMIFWFVPAFTALICVRQAVRTLADIRLLSWLVAANAALLAAFGIGQFLSGTTAIYWCVPLSDHFFASFGYANHAGSYFVLMLCVWIGLTLDTLVYQNPGRARSRQIAGCALGVLLMLMAVHFTLCRAAILFSWAIVAIAATAGSAATLSRLPPATQVRAMASTVAILVLGYFTVAALAHDPVGRELASLSVAETFSKNLTLRSLQVQAALRIWLDNIWFGAGGWGFRHLAALHMEPARWDVLRTVGRANVHTDLVQFLSEFGVVGTGLFLVSVLTGFWPLFRRPRLSEGFILMSFVGVIAVALHSVIDLPFRSPAVLATWLTVGATGARYAAIVARLSRDPWDLSFALAYPEPSHMKHPSRKQSPSPRRQDTPGGAAQERDPR